MGRKDPKAPKSCWPSCALGRGWKGRARDRIKPQPEIHPSTAYNGARPIPFRRDPVRDFSCGERRLGTAWNGRRFIWDAKRNRAKIMRPTALLGTP